jgi:hypothetical protein
MEITAANKFANLMNVPIPEQFLQTYSPRQLSSVPTLTDEGLKEVIRTNNGTLIALAD